MVAMRGLENASPRCGLWGRGQVSLLENLHPSPQWNRRLKPLRKEGKPCRPQGTCDDPLQLWKWKQKPSILGKGQKNVLDSKLKNPFQCEWDRITEKESPTARLRVSGRRLNWEYRVPSLLPSTSSSSIPSPNIPRFYSPLISFHHNHLSIYSTNIWKSAICHQTQGCSSEQNRETLCLPSVCIGDTERTK